MPHGLGNLLRVIQGLLCLSGYERSYKQRAVVLIEQGLQNAVLGHTQAYGFARRVAQAARHFFRGFKDEGKRARRALLEQAKLPIIYPRIRRQLAQIAAQERKVVFVIYATNLPHAVAGGFVINMASKGITRVSRYGKHFTLRQQCCCFFQDTRLRIEWVDFE